jgi:hypothetical protein
MKLFFEPADYEYVTTEQAHFDIPTEKVAIVKALI